SGRQCPIVVLSLPMSSRAATCPLCQLMPTTPSPDREMDKPPAVGQNATSTTQRQGGTMDASPIVGEPYQLSTWPRWITGACVVRFVLVGYLLYESYTTGTVFEAGLSKANDQAKLLSALVDQTNGRLADMKGQLDVAAQKLGLTQAELARARSLAQRIRKERKASDE